MGEENTAAEHQQPTCGVCGRLATTAHDVWRGSIEMCVCQDCFDLGPQGCVASLLKQAEDALVIGREMLTWQEWPPVYVTHHWRAP